MPIAEGIHGLIKMSIILIMRLIHQLLEMGKKYQLADMKETYLEHHI
jgi:hypothetical protein